MDKRRIFIHAGWLACQVTVLISMMALVSCHRPGNSQTIISYGQFRNVTIHGAINAPSRVIVFVSEKGESASHMKAITDALVDDHTLLIWIDVADYLHSLSASTDKSVYPAGDFEMLSQYVQRRLGLIAYQHPILIGHGQGAALVYAVLAEAPQTFPGAVSIDFCPELEFSKALSKGKLLMFSQTSSPPTIRLLPSQRLEAPWLVFQTNGCCRCDLFSIKAFVDQVGNSRLTVINKAERGVTIPPEGLSEIKAAVQAIAGSQDQKAASATNRLGDLPLVELSCPSGDGTWLAVIVSGDGGWAGIDSDIGEVLVTKGIPVVGLDSLKYFWTSRTPNGASLDLYRIIDHYRNDLNKRDILLIGYSRGADVLPFMVNRLPEETRSQVRLLALLGLSHAVSFEFHLSDWISGTSSASDLPILPEIVNLKGMKILCFCGDSEEDSL